MFITILCKKLCWADLFYIEKRIFALVNSLDKIAFFFQNFIKNLEGRGTVYKYGIGTIGNVNRDTYLFIMYITGTGTLKGVCHEIFDLQFFS